MIRIFKDMGFFQKEKKKKNASSGRIAIYLSMLLYLLLLRGLSMLIYLSFYK